MIQNGEQVLIYNNSIDFNFKNFNRAYLVKICINENDDSSNIISYKTQVNYTKEYTKPYYLAEVYISNFLLNDELHQTIMQNIAMECSKAIEKCVFQVNTKNEINGLENHKEILEKWHTIKQKVVQENEGALFEKYVMLFENTLINKALLFQKLQKNLFINQYFFAIFDEPYHGFKKKNIEKFDFFDAEYQEEMLVEIENEGAFDANNNVILHKKLIKTPKNIEENIIQNYDAKYTLNKDRSIKKIKGEFLNHNKKYSFEINEEVVR